MEVCRSVVEVFLVDRIGRAVQEGGLLNSGVGAAEKEVLGRLISFVSRPFLLLGRPNS